MKKIRTKLNKLFSLALAVCIIVSIFGLTNLTGFSTMAADENILKIEGCRADANTMDSFRKALDLNDNSKNAGRVWSDKTVLTDDSITLDLLNDGVNGGNVNNESDFLHVFSALGSSRNLEGVIPSNLVIVIDNSGSMYTNDKENWNGTRIAKTVDAVNRAIDSLMENDVLSQVAVVSFNNTGRTIIPLGHYGYTKGEGYTKYLDAGWVLAQEPDGNDEPNHTDSSRVTSGGTAGGGAGGDDDDEGDTDGDDESTPDEDNGGGYIYVNNEALWKEGQPKPEKNTQFTEAKTPIFKQVFIRE